MGILDSSSDAIVRLIASDSNWIEGNAVQQLERTAKLKGVKRAVGLPDLHAGKGCPIGAAFLSEGWLYPALVGNDIGCGMGLWRTELKASKLKLEKWAAKLYLDATWEGDTGRWLESYHLPANLFNESIGTIGGGNHFAELQRVETIYDADACAALDIDKKRLYLLAHSGSRGLGHAILRSHVDRFRDSGLQEDSAEATEYVVAHNQALQWARANRALIAHRFSSALGSDEQNVFDVSHNTVTPKIVDGVTHWLHRKGASPADEGPLVIPGSRGTFSYLVQPLEKEQISSAFSLAHGAGRKWMRSDAKGRLSGKYRPDDFLEDGFGRSCRLRR